jgi:VanZ family protein
VRLLLAFITFLIIYGSLYPFNFIFQHIDKSLIAHLFSFSFGLSGITDLISNIVLFIPFGFICIKCFNAKTNTLTKITITLTVAFTLAFGIQVIQLLTPERIPSGSDATWNMVGCLIGMFLAKFKLPNTSYFQNIKHSSAIIPFTLACALLLYNLAPFVPSLDIQSLKNNLKALISVSNINVFWAFEKTVLWLVAFYFLNKTNISNHQSRVFIGLVFCILAIKLFLISGGGKLDHLISGISALFIWFIAKPLLNRKSMAFLLIMAIIVMNFEPFQLREQISSFLWMPFSGSLGGNLILNIFAVSKKVLIYASLVWLISQSGLQIKKATLIVFGFVFIIEYLQIFFTSATPEITDSLLVLITGIIFYQILQKNSLTPLPIDNTKPNEKTKLQQNHNAQPTHYLLGINGLRAIAALSVFFVHINQKYNIEGSFLFFDINRWLVNGNSGVTLFFLISGFLLSTPFWKNKISFTSSPNLTEYFTRRMVRIVPAYYVCLMILIIASFITGGGADGGNILSHLTFSYNFSNDYIFSFNPPFWTLAVEVQFYLLLPLLFLVLKRFTAKQSFHLVLLLVPSIYLLNYLMVSIVGESAKTSYSTLAHLPHFLIGVLSAYLLVNKSNIAKKLSKPIKYF